MSDQESTRTPYVANETPHPWRRFVAIGDSFTEGIGDPDPAAPGGHRGWADRVAEVLAQQVDDFAYANLAVRGKLIAQIVADQVEPAVALRPDLISICAGGNDVIRPGTDPDAIADQLEDAVALTPGMEGPTVSPLHREGWVAVRSMVPRKKAQAIMDDLWQIGARAILVTDIYACRL